MRPEFWIVFYVLGAAYCLLGLVFALDGSVILRFALDTTVLSNAAFVIEENIGKIQSRRAHRWLADRGYFE